jgi:molybdopterin-guanine dinucleotide biosynthesis protein A
MGTNKAWIKIGGKPLIIQMVEKFSPLFSSLLIITNTPREYEKLGVKLFQDVTPYQGPLGGIYTGLLKSKTKANFFLGCDMPFFKTELINHLKGRIRGYQGVVVSLKKKIQPLGSIYTKACLPIIEEQLSRKEQRVLSFIERIKIRYVGEEEIKKIDPQLISFFNLNQKSDLKKAQIIWKKYG